MLRTGCPFCLAHSPLSRHLSWEGARACGHCPPYQSILHQRGKLLPPSQFLGPGHTGLSAVISSLTARREIIRTPPLPPRGKDYARSPEPGKESVPHSHSASSFPPQQLET